MREVRLILGAIAGAMAGFVVSSFLSGGRNIFGTYMLYLIGTIVEVTPRRFLPDRFLWWYNDTLEVWTP
jgi:uncharacterized membrane protein YeaQ/YmgE (transglycosylase-associated protein family)